MRVKWVNTRETKDYNLEKKVNRKDLLENSLVKMGNKTANSVSSSVTMASMMDLMDCNLERMGYNLVMMGYSSG